MSITKTRLGMVGIGEVSRRTAVNAETIRYYERIGLIPKPGRTAGGRRIYGAVEERKLALVRRARDLGFPLEMVRALLNFGEPGQSTCSDVCTVAEGHLADIRSRIADLRKLETYLSSIVARCAGGTVADCAVLDALTSTVRETAGTAASL